MSEQTADVKRETTKEVSLNGTGTESAVQLTEQVDMNSTTQVETEDGEIIKSTPELKQRAMYVHQRLGDAIDTLYDYASDMITNKLYLHLGFENSKQYFEAINMGKTQFYKHAFIGEGLKKSGHLKDGSYTPTAQRALGIGKEKTHRILKDLEDQAEAFLSEGKIEIGGTVYELDDLHDMTVGKLREEIEKANQKAARTDLAEERLKNTQMENKELQKQKKDLKKWKEDHQERADTQDDIGRVIERCAQLGKELNAGLTELKVDNMFEKAKDDQQQDLVVLLDRMRARIAEQRARFAEVTDMVYDRQVGMDEGAEIDKVLGEVE